jgi:hypothetical protein
MAAFLLIILGTAGLLLNEYAFDWGSAATILFATLNVIGLSILGISYLRGGKTRRS